MQQQAPLPTAIGARYRVESLLGEGGMAAVYRVVDTSRGQTLALKRLSRKGDKPPDPRVALLFEQEFHTLAQLAHPRVIEVYDYVADEAGAFYTMELLDGGDLRDSAPMPWRTACSLLRDVCSALSLLHSRRFVHRDLTPRNVRCTRDGTAKLIDFGAILPFGPSKHAVGTPPFTPPETLTGQVLDARADLFSLGATAYYALTRRHAYPAQSFETLRNAWRTSPVTPSRIVPGIPPALDELVLSLLQLSPVARPASAAEVMERLAGIAGLPHDEQLVVQKAFLSTPTLVGREEPLITVRKQLARMSKGQGATTLITGAPGVGRSRMLDACVLDAKLAGATVLRVDASDAGAGRWGGARAIVRQLLEALPARALETALLHAPALVHVLPELVRALRSHGHAEVTPAEFDSPQQLRAAVQIALRAWLLEIAKQRTIVLAVDDLHRLDEPSAALVSLLARETHNAQLSVLATTESTQLDGGERAVAMLADAGYSIKLRPLPLEDVERLLESVFGDVPNVRLLADRLYAVSLGSPRAVMQLAQLLLDRGVIRYQAGAFVLPADIDPEVLPRSIGEALALRVKEASPRARTLAQTIALATPYGFSVDDCLVLGLHAEMGALIVDLDQLIALGILSTDGERYRLAQAGLRPVLLAELDRAQPLHERLVKLFARSGQEPFRVAQHLLHAGKQEAAADALLGVIEAVRAKHLTDPPTFFDYLDGLPRDWVATYRAAIDTCASLGRSPRQLYMLRSHYVSCAAASALSPYGDLREILVQLRRESGLDLYDQLGETVPAAERLGQALTAAQARFDATPEAQRGLTPIESIQALAQVTVSVIGVVGRAFDLDYLESIPSLAPFTVLSPALTIVDKNRRNTEHILAGRTEQARTGYQDTLNRIEGPDGNSLDPSTRLFMSMAIRQTIGTLEAHAGLPSATTWADSVEPHPLFAVNAWRLRMLTSLRQGDWEQAARHRRQQEATRIQNSAPQLFEGSQLWSELLCYAAAEDLLRVKEATPGIEQMAQELPNWKPCARYARAQYHLLRGDPASAVPELELALSEARPGRHVAWASITGALITALHETDRIADARELGLRAVQEAEQNALGYMRYYLLCPLALAHSALGDHQDATRCADAAIAVLTDLGARGLALGAAYEARARVAIAMQEPETFQHFAKLCAEQFRIGHNPVLTAKYDRLLNDARREELGVSHELARAADFTVASSRLANLLSACHGPDERAKAVLKALVERSACAGGLLYTLQSRGPVLAARSGAQRPPADLDQLIAEFLQTELHHSQDATIATGAETEPRAADWMGPDADRFVPLLLHHRTDDHIAITGLVLLCVGPSGIYHHPEELLSALSQALADAGDVVTAMVA